MFSEVSEGFQKTSQITFMEVSKTLQCFFMAFQEVTDEFYEAYLLSGELNDVQRRFKVLQCIPECYKRFQGNF